MAHILLCGATIQQLPFPPPLFLCIVASHSTHKHTYIHTYTCPSAQLSSDNTPYSLSLSPSLSFSLPLFLSPPHIPPPPPTSPKSHPIPPTLRSPLIHPFPSPLSPNHPLFPNPPRQAPDSRLTANHSIPNQSIPDQSIPDQSIPGPSPSSSSNPCLPVFF